MMIVDISTKNIIKGKLDCEKFNFPYWDIFQLIFVSMRLDLIEYYKTCVQISYKTSNNQEILENMPYYVFLNFVHFLSEIIADENKQSESTGTNENMTNTLSSTKNMLNRNMGGFNYKLPKKL